MRIIRIVLPSGPLHTVSLACCDRRTPIMSHPTPYQGSSAKQTLAYPSAVCDTAEEYNRLQELSCGWQRRQQHRRRTAVLDGDGIHDSRVDYSEPEVVKNGERRTLFRFLKIGSFALSGTGRVRAPNPQSTRDSRLHPCPKV